MKMKAIFTVEFEVEDGANAHAALDQALGRAETALKESIERSTPGAAGMDVRPNSTSIAVTSQIE
jgi:5,10-methylenetetrahydrofolate reductase